MPVFTKEVKSLLVRDSRVILAVFFLWVLFSLLFPLPRPKNPESGPGGGKKQAAQGPECLALKVWYDGYNEAYFSNMLPKDTLVGYGTPGLADAMASTRKIGNRFVITLDKKYTLAPKVAHESILHEMCHVENFNEIEDHGKKWRGCMEVLDRKGAFRDFW